MSLSDFLLARIAEDEERIPAEVRTYRSPWAAGMAETMMRGTVELRRNGVTRALFVARSEASVDYLRQAAERYAEHPDYDEAWRP